MSLSKMSGTEQGGHGKVKRDDSASVALELGKVVQSLADATVDEEGQPRQVKRKETEEGGLVEKRFKSSYSTCGQAVQGQDQVVKWFEVNVPAYVKKQIDDECKTLLEGGLNGGKVSLDRLLDIQKKHTLKYLQDVEQEKTGVVEGLDG